MFQPRITAFSRGPRILIPSVFALLAIVLAACGGGGGSPDDSDAFAPSGVPTAAPANAQTSGEAATDSRGGEVPVAAQPTSAAGSAAPGSPDWDQMVIRTAQLTLRVDNVADAVAWVRTLAIGKGGFVFSSSSSIQDDQHFAQLTIQVPVDRFDEAMNEIRSSSLVDTVEREESSSQDVTAEFVDSEARLAALRETQSRFLALLAKAETVDDILRLEYELTNVRSEIEQIQGRQNYLKDATSFSTITVSLYPTGAATPKAKDEGFSISESFQRAWDRSRGAIESLLTGTITVAIFALILLPFALVAWVVLRAYRSRVRSRAVENV